MDASKHCMMKVAPSVPSTRYDVGHSGRAMGCYVVYLLIALTSHHLFLLLLNGNFVGLRGVALVLPTKYTI